MRRRKKDKVVQKEVVASTEDILESSRRGMSVKFAKNVDGGGGTGAEKSPIQPRKRSLLGSLGSVRDLVEQVGVGVCLARQLLLLFFIGLEPLLSLCMLTMCVMLLL